MNQETRVSMQSQLFTVQPSGVVLIGPHGRLLPQSPEDGRVRPHEIDVDPSVQLSICQATKERRKAVTSAASRPAKGFQVQLEGTRLNGLSGVYSRTSGTSSSCENPIHLNSRLSSSRAQTSCFGFHKLAS